MSDANDDDRPLTAAEKRAAAREAAAKPAPVPIEFHAADRYHAMTYVVQGLPDVADEVKDRLHKVLQGVTHPGPVHVAIPAPPATPGASVADADAAEDPAAPADGAFLVKPYRFVRV